jgi:two-component system, OmpR family, response regulator
MRILIIDDEHQFARNIQKYLLLEKYAADIAFDGEKGLEMALLNEYDCVVLDLNLPKIDGIAVCHQLRKSGKSMPILMLTARSGVDDVIIGLDSGADDYLKKPFEMSELLARIRSLVRRKSDDRNPSIENGSIRIDTNAKETYIDDKIVKLSPKEYCLLEFLFRNKGCALERTRLISHIWGAREDQLIFSQTLDVHIAYLRKKLGKDCIQTVPGRGYMIPIKHNV